MGYERRAMAWARQVRDLVHARRRAITIGYACEATGHDEAPYGAQSALADLADVSVYEWGGLTWVVPVIDEEPVIGGCLLSVPRSDDAWHGTDGP